MIEVLQKFIDQIKEFLTWWVIISPWEKGIRVRFGNRVKLLNSGIHFRIPIFDQIYKQSVRSRNISSSIQTISTSDGVAVSIGITIQYNICDIYKLYNSLYHPEATIQNMVISRISKYIAENPMNKCHPDILSKLVDEVDFKNYGIDLENVGITTYAVVKTFRLIQDSSWLSEGYNLELDK